MRAKVLVTGVAGFIGSHLSESLIAAGWQVVGVDNFDGFYSSAIKRQNLTNLLLNSNFRLVEADVRDEKCMELLFHEEAFHSVVHLAALAGVLQSQLEPERYWDVNVNGTLSILKSLVRMPIKSKFLLVSSSSVYGARAHLPFEEGESLGTALSPYAQSKVQAEKELQYFQREFNFSAACCRLFNVYGPRQRPDLMVAKFVKQIESRQTIQIYGPPKSSRDFSYIDDIVDGLVKCLNWLNRQGSAYEIFNIASSHPLKITQALSIIEQELGQTADVEHLDLRPGEMISTHAAIEKAKTVLAYLPHWNFRDGLRKYLQSLR